MLNTYIVPDIRLVLRNGCECCGLNKGIRIRRQCIEDQFSLWLSSFKCNRSPRDTVQALQVMTESIVVNHMDMVPASDEGDNGETSMQVSQSERSPLACMKPEEHDAHTINKRRVSVLDVHTNNRVPSYTDEDYQALLHYYSPICWDTHVLDLWIASKDKFFSIIAKQYLNFAHLVKDPKFRIVFGEAQPSDLESLFDNLQRTYRPLPHHNASLAVYTLHFTIIALRHMCIWSHASNFNRFMIVLATLGLRAGHFGLTSGQCLDILKRGDVIEPLSANLDKIKATWKMVSPNESIFWFNLDPDSPSEPCSPPKTATSRCHSSDIPSMPIVEIYSYLLLEYLLLYTFENIKEERYDVHMGCDLLKLLTLSDTRIYIPLMDTMTTLIFEQKQSAIQLSTRILPALLFGTVGYFLLSPKGIDRYLFATGRGIEVISTLDDYKHYYEREDISFDQLESRQVCKAAFGEGSEKLKECIDKVSPFLTDMPVSCNEAFKTRLSNCYRSTLLFINSVNQFDFELMHRRMTQRTAPTCKSEDDRTSRSPCRSPKLSGSMHIDGPYIVYNQLHELTTRIVKDRLQLLPLSVAESYDAARAASPCCSNINCPDRLTMEYELENWDFHILRYWRELSTNFFAALLSKVLDLTSLVEDPTFQSIFIGATVEDVKAAATDLQATYHYLPYHNAGHAGMVLHHTLFILRKQHLWEEFSPYARFLIAISALAHDAGHFGCSSVRVRNAMTQGVVFPVIGSMIDHMRAIWGTLDDSDRRMWWEIEEYDDGEHPFPGDPLWQNTWPCRPYVELYHVALLERILTERLHMQWTTCSSEARKLFQQLVRVNIVYTDASAARQFRERLRQTNFLHINNRISHALCLSDIANTLLNSKGVDRYILAVAVAAETATTDSDPLFYLKEQIRTMNRTITPTTKLFNTQLSNFSFADGQELFLESMVVPLLNYVSDIYIQKGVTFQNRFAENGHMAQRMTALLTSKWELCSVLGGVWKNKNSLLQ